MKLADEIKLMAGGPGSGPRPGGGSDLIDPKHPKLFRVTYKPAGSKRSDALNTAHVSGDSRAHAERRFVQANPDAISVSGTHAATKASDGTWRGPTVRISDLDPNNKNPKGLAVDDWKHYKF